MNKIEHKKYSKKWRIKNKDKIVEYRLKNKEKFAEYKLKNKEKLSEQSKVYTLKNKKKITKYNKVYRTKNKEKIAKKSKAYKLKNKEKIKEHALKNRDKTATYNKEYRLNNKTKIRKYQNTYRLNNKEKMKQWRIENRDKIEQYKIKNKKKISERHSTHTKHRYNTNVKFKIKYLLRTRVYKALKGENKSLPTMFLIGCEIDYFMYHIQCQFTKRMNWDNHGAGNHGKGMKEWHIDHIKPCDSFDLSKPLQQRKCFHYSNMQPLWATINLQKRYKYDRNL